MKSMSPGPSDVSRPTRSPGFSSTGPEVVRSCTPISRAMSMASVVLPRPGGPKNSVWSSVSRRPLAASIAICSELFTCSCPTNSSSRDGRSAASAPVSSGRGSGVVTCSLFMPCLRQWPVRVLVFTTEGTEKGMNWGEQQRQILAVLRALCASVVNPMPAIRDVSTDQSSSRAFQRTGRSSGSTMCHARQ